MLNEGEIFIKAGDRSPMVAVVLDGMLRNYIINNSGDEVTVVFATDMQALAPYSTTFLDRPASETTIAVQPSVILAVDFNAFRKKALDDPILTRVYIDIIESAFVAAIERIEDFTKIKPEQRYKRLLQTHGFLIEQAPLKFVASYLGITPVSLSRIRKRLSQNRNYPL
jgi:CRP-like cAMP-binding protein